MGLLEKRPVAARIYEISGKVSRLGHKTQAVYDFPLKKHIKTRYFANNRLKIVHSATFVP